MKSLDTVTTVETGDSLHRDRIRINGIVPTSGEEARARIVIDKLRELAGERTRVRVESRNANVKGKGVGFSASGFAALGLAASRAQRMRRAIGRKDVSEICRLAEVDTLNLHAITMTGRLETILVSPLSVRIMDEVRRLREEEGVLVWYSLDTGPSVFVNTTPRAASKVARRIRTL